MKNKTEKTEGTTENKKTRQRRNINIFKFEKEGVSVVGRYVGTFDRDWTDKATGEVKLLRTLVLENESKERTGIFMDAGLKNAFESAMVKEGEETEIVYLGQTELKGGRRVNQYDVLV